MTKDKIVYEIEVPQAEREVIDDTPDAYRVVVPHASHCCCVIYGRYHGRWKANVSCRWLVMHLLDKIELLRGGVADLQRHVKVAVDEDATRIPPGLLAVIGAMHKALKEIV